MPAVVISSETAETISGMFHKLAEARVSVVLRERMQQANLQAQQMMPFVVGQSVAVQPANVEQYVANESYRDLMATNTRFCRPMATCNSCTTTLSIKIFHLIR